MKIIDISSNNGIIDWKKVQKDSVSDVIIRLSLGYGDYDKMAEKYAKEASSVGLSVSYYHLGYPDKKSGSLQTDAIQEADYFVSLFKGGKLPNPRWLAIDLEKMANGWDTPLTKSEYLEWLTIFLYEVNSSTGLTCMIYSNKPYLDAHLPTNHKLGEIPLWISNYNTVASPLLPNGWKSYFLWQYSSSGSINGISTKVDLNVTYKSIYIEKLLIKYKNKSSKAKLPLDKIRAKVLANNKSPFSSELVISICWAESSFDASASASPASTSKGLMMMNNQAVDVVNNNTPAGIHFNYSDMFDPDKAISCGTWYLKLLYEKPDWNCNGDKRKTLRTYRGVTDFIYADKIIACESCLKSAVIKDQQVCLNQIHTLI